MRCTRRAVGAMRRRDAGDGRPSRCQASTRSRRRTRSRRARRRSTLVDGAPRRSRRRARPVDDDGPARTVAAACDDRRRRRALPIRATRVSSTTSPRGRAARRCRVPTVRRVERPSRRRRSITPRRRPAPVPPGPSTDPGRHRSRSTAVATGTAITTSGVERDPSRSTSCTVRRPRCSPADRATRARCRRRKSSRRGAPTAARRRRSFDPGAASPVVDRPEPASRIRQSEHGTRSGIVGDHDATHRRDR